MVRLLPQPHAANPAAPKSNVTPLPSSKAPGFASSLMYTLLRHGRGLSDEAARTELRQRLDGPFQAA